MPRFYYCKGWWKLATNNANSDIEILVGVQGGESISDGSGQLISATLKKIAAQISQQQIIKVSVGADLRTSKNSIQKILNQADLKIHNIGFGENVSTKLQNQLGKMAFSIDVSTNLKEAEKPSQRGTRKKKIESQKTNDPKETDYLSRNAKVADKFFGKLSRIDAKNDEVVMSAEQVAKAYSDAENAINDLAKSSDKYNAISVGRIEGLIDKLNAKIAEEKRIQKTSASSDSVIVAKNTGNQAFVDQQLKNLDNAIIKAGNIGQMSAVKEKYAEIRSEIQLCADSAEKYEYEQQKALRSTVAEINDVISTQRKLAKDESWESIEKATAKSHDALADFDKYLQTLNPKVFTECAGEIENIKNLLSKETPDAVKQAEIAIKNFKAQMKKAGYEGGNIFTLLGSKIKTFATYLVSSSLTIGVAGSIGNVVNTVKTLDEALTDLMIVTGNTKAETKALISTYNQMAQQLGSTTAEVASGATDWLRQGYGQAESQELLKQSMTLSIVGDMDAEASTSALTAALKGLQLQASQASEVVDKFFKVDMMAATSAENMANALAKTAANAKVAGISLDDVIGQLAVVNETMVEAGESTGRQNCLAA